jgi:NAD(P)-dependent dehydrogenase (short-subunit alcohol dehydrogenase family)
MTVSIVTGANRGLGLSLTRLLCARGDHVLGACRTPSPELEATGAEIVTGIDVASEDGPGALARALGDRKVSLLLNNAGILSWDDRLDALDPDGIRRQLEVNAIGPLRLTAALRGHLVPGAKVAFITSRMGSIEDNSSGAFYGYRMSKAALNMAAKSLSVDLLPQGVLVAILHPGMVKTDMVKGHGQVEPEDAARNLIARIDALTAETTGTFWHANGEILPW